MLIEIYGTPKEFVVGEITEEQYEFWKERECGYGDSPSLVEYCVKKDEYQIDEEYDFIIDDWSDLNDVYFSTGFSQNNEEICFDEILVKFTYDDHIERNEILRCIYPKIDIESIELDEPDIGSFHFLGNEIYENQICFSATLDEDFELETFDQKILKEISFSQDIIYDQKIITGVLFRNVNLPNKAKINSSVIDQKFYLKP